MQEAADDVELLQHGVDEFFDGNASLISVTRRIFNECFLKVREDADVIDDEAAWLRLSRSPWNLR